MSFEGKKYKKYDFKNVVEIIDTLNLDEKIRALLRDSNVTTSFSKTADGKLNIKAETPEKVVLDESFPLGTEVEFPRPDGKKVKTKVWFEGEVLKQTIGSTKVVLLERHFDGDKLTLYISTDGIATKGEVYYTAV